MLKLHFLGVGDGDCIVIELPDGRFGLIDSNHRPDLDHSPALAHLDEQPLAFCCLSHPHDDHYTGMLEVLMAAGDGSVGDQSVFWYSLSDLDKVFEHLFNPVIAGDDNRVSQAERERRLGGLFELFNWVRDQRRLGFSECISGVSFRSFGDVSLTLVGPSAKTLDRYRRYLARQRERQLPVCTQYANRISLVILISYAGRSAWLLGDLTRQGLRQLPRRIEQQSPAECGPDTKASILKVSHHGASNAWFKEIGSVLTTCNPEDIIVFSANGRDHPSRTVWEAWQASGKRLVGTWADAPSRSSADWAEDSLSTVAGPVSETQPRDATVTIDPNGNVDLQVTSP